MCSKREAKAACARNANFSRQAGVHVLCLFVIRFAADSVAADAILDEGIASEGPSGPKAHYRLSMSLWPWFAMVSRPTQRLSVPRSWLGIAFCVRTEKKVLALAVLCQAGVREESGCQEGAPAYGRSHTVLSLTMTCCAVSAGHGAADLSRYVLLEPSQGVSSI